MVKRGKAPLAGLWSLPGGTLEWGETLAEAVKREVWEETRVDVVVEGLAGVFEAPSNRGEGAHFVILDYFARPVTPPDRAPAPVAGQDAADARWVPLEDVSALACTPRLVETLRAWGVPA
jgi:ADP-ribose pyrophosphatase YjhB (NUDIX family)